MEYQIYPLWAFLKENFSFEEAFSLFGPYVGANIHCRKIDEYTIESFMDLVPSNTNYLGSHFGGSLYSMCDPFFMFLLIEHLGKNYMVWDKKAVIEFLKPAKGKVRAKFHIPPQKISEIKERVDANRKLEEVFFTEIVQENPPLVVAKVEKVLYIRRLKVR